MRKKSKIQTCLHCQKKFLSENEDYKSPELCILCMSTLTTSPLNRNSLNQKEENKKFTQKKSAQENRKERDRHLQDYSECFSVKNLFCPIDYQNCVKHNWLKEHLICLNENCSDRLFFCFECKDSLHKKCFNEQIIDGISLQKLMISEILRPENQDIENWTAFLVFKQVKEMGGHLDKFIELMRDNVLEKDKSGNTVLENEETQEIQKDLFAKIQVIKKEVEEEHGKKLLDAMCDLNVRMYGDEARTNIEYDDIKNK